MKPNRNPGHETPRNEQSLDAELLPEESIYDEVERCYGDDFVDYVRRGGLD